MRKTLVLLLLAACSLGVSSAQTTAVSATVVDSDSTTWANGTWSIDFKPGPGFFSPSQYNINGAKLDPAVYSQHGSLDASGVLAVTVYDSSIVTPGQSGWTLSVCSNTSAPCSSYQFSTAGASQNISAALTAIISAPRFRAVSGSYGYNDTEAQLQLVVGATYYNVTTPGQRCYSGSAWAACSSGGGGSTAFSALTPGANNTSGVYSFGPNATFRSSNPITLTAPFHIVTDGDSRMCATAGAGSCNNMIVGMDLGSRLAAQPQFSQNTGLFNLAISGTDICSILNRYSTTTSPNITNVHAQSPAVTGVPAYYIVLTGIANGNFPLATYSGCYQNLMNLALADGYKPIMLLDYLGTPATDAAILLWNQYHDWQMAWSHQQGILSLDAQSAFPATLTNSPWYGASTFPVAITGYTISNVVGATAHATIAAGVVTAITTDTAGTGCDASHPPVVLIGGTNTTPASFTVACSGSGIGTFTQVSGGTGYGAVAAVAFEGVGVFTSVNALAGGGGTLLWLDQFPPTSRCLNSSYVTTTSATGTTFTAPIACPAVASSTDAGVWQNPVISASPHAVGLHLNAAGIIRLATHLNNQMQAALSGTSSERTSYQDMFTSPGNIGTYDFVGGSQSYLRVGAALTYTPSIGGEIVASSAAGTGIFRLGTDGTNFIRANAGAWSINTPTGGVTWSALTGFQYKGGGGTFCATAVTSCPAASNNGNVASYTNAAATAGVVLFGSTGNINNNGSTVGFNTPGATTFNHQVVSTAEGFAGAGLTINGTLFTTNAGCGTVTSPAGGSTAGIMTLAANTCTVVITLGGQTATHAWHGTMTDRTTNPGTQIGESASAAGTISFTIPVTWGTTDNVTFVAFPF